MAGRSEGDRREVHPLLLGRTKVPYGQFYGGRAGWEGLGALLRFVTDKRHFIWVPIHAYLAEHPREGLILLDTGTCRAQAHQHRDYYRGILRFVLDDDECAQEPHETLTQQLGRLGHRCDDVRTVILRQLHEDHVGGLRDLPKAKVRAGVRRRPGGHRSRAGLTAHGRNPRQEDPMQIGALVLAVLVLAACHPGHFPPPVAFAAISVNCNGNKFDITTGTGGGKCSVTYGSDGKALGGSCQDGGNVSNVNCTLNGDKGGCGDTGGHGNCTER